MDKNQAARRFMLGWRLRVEPKQGAAAWIAPDDGEEPVAYTAAARIVAALAEHLDTEQTDERIEYFLPDDDDGAEV